MEVLGFRDWIPGGTHAESVWRPAQMTNEPLLNKVAIPVVDKFQLPRQEALDVWRKLTERILATTGLDLRTSKDSYLWEIAELDMTRLCKAHLVPGGLYLVLFEREPEKVYRVTLKSFEVSSVGICMPEMFLVNLRINRLVLFPHEPIGQLAINLKL
ncbi:MAG: hypothetical protein H6534_08965 [Chthonomonadaceae bacterium]|nr:hypothetical protein [Chthonomonadaceae bacterium]